MFSEFKKKREERQKAQLEFAKAQQEEMRRNAEQEQQKQQQEVRELVEKYKQDEDVLALADAFMNGYMNGHLDYLECYGHPPVRDIQFYIQNEGVFENDHFGGFTAFFLYTNKFLYFFVLEDNRPWCYREDHGFRFDFTKNYFDPIYDENKLEAVATVVLDRMVENAYEMAKKYNCDVNVGYEKKEQFYKIQCYVSDVVGLVGDEEYQHQMSICSRKTYSEYRIDEDPSKNICKGAIFLMKKPNSKKRQVRSL